MGQEKARAGAPAQDRRHPRPDEVLRIDFAKPHDFHYGNGLVFAGCVLVGFTTPNDEVAGGGGFGEWSHDRWMALRQPDGRLVYVPREGLEWIAESG